MALTSDANLRIDKNVLQVRVILLVAACKHDRPKPGVAKIREQPVIGCLDAVLVQCGMLTDMDDRECSSAPPVSFVFWGEVVL